MFYFKESKLQTQISLMKFPGLVQRFDTGSVKNMLVKYKNVQSGLVQTMSYNNIIRITLLDSDRKTLGTDEQYWPQGRVTVLDDSKKLEILKFINQNSNNNCEIIIDVNTEFDFDTSDGGTVNCFNNLNDFGQKFKKMTINFNKKFYACQVNVALPQSSNPIPQFVKSDNNNSRIITASKQKHVINFNQNNVNNGTIQWV